MSLRKVCAAALGILLLGASSQRPKPKPSPNKQKAHRASLRQHAHRTKSIPLRHAPGSSAERYAALTPNACLAELNQRHVPFQREEAKRGVKIPVRLTGKVGGVLYRTDYPDAERAREPWEIFDCRLVLSLDDFSAVLRQHEVSEVRIFSAWRPPAATWPMDQWARRHPGALAVDVRELRKDSGEALNVLEQFHGRLEAPLCGSNAAGPVPDTPAARELRAIVCAAAESQLFNSILTPNYNPAHKNHFHLELTPDVDWFMLR